MANRGGLLSIPGLMRAPRLAPPLLLAAILAGPLGAEDRPTTRRDAGRLYQQHCAACHGRGLQGGLAPSMLDDTWTHGSSDEDLARIIREGVPDAMTGFSAELSEAEIRGLVILIRERRADFRPDRDTQPLPTEPVATELHRYRIETVVDDLVTPWAIDFLPDGRMLVTEKDGRLRLVQDGRLLPPIKGVPAVRSAGQGGLMEVAVHPRHAENGWIYLAYSDPAVRDGREVSLTVIVRGRIRGGAWVDQETIWRAPLEFYRPGGGVHFGCRIAFDPEGFLYFSHGERGRPEDAQNLVLPNGKVHRIHDDGKVPADNPFVGRADAFPTIWTYGNRNPQGLDFDPRTGLLWETEHGPRGGDELNVLHRGANYGWPAITHGMNYNGTPVSALTARDGMEAPVAHWTPSLAVCGIDFYTGDRFPRWRGHLFVAALAQQEVRRIVIEDGQVVAQEVILKDLGRVRDVASGPDGALYLALNQPDRIVRLVPVD